MSAAVNVQQRKALVSDYKRSLIREAARSVFARGGIEAASMRAIAAEAGYTTGAIYVHFATKEELYADLLGESLDALLGELAAAEGGTILEAFVRFYRERPQDFELSFYLQGGGVKASGLSPDLDRRLNERMAAIVDLVGRAVAGEERPPAEVRRAGTAACSHAFGLLLMARTGRLQILGEDLDEHVALLLTTYAR